MATRSKINQHADLNQPLAIQLGLGEVPPQHHRATKVGQSSHPQAHSHRRQEVLVQEVLVEEDSQQNARPLMEQRASNNNRSDPNAMVTIADLNTIRKDFNNQIGALTQAI